MKQNIKIQGTKPSTTLCNESSYKNGKEVALELLAMYVRISKLKHRIYQ